MDGKDGRFSKRWERKRNVLPERPKRFIANALMRRNSFQTSAASRKEVSCIVAFMTCPELQHLTNLADAARDQLTHHAMDSQPSIVGTLSVAERSARIALFSADIDLLFHKARCPRCQQLAEELPVAA